MIYGLYLMWLRFKIIYIALVWWPQTDKMAQIKLEILQRLV